MNLFATKQQIDALGNIDSQMPTVTATPQGPLTQNLDKLRTFVAKSRGILEKGAEVHPALMAPESVKNLYPDFKKLGAVESRIKKIAEKAGS